MANKYPMPNLEGNQGPQSVTIVGLSAPVFVDESPQVFLLEVATALGLKHSHQIWIPFPSPLFLAQCKSFSCG